MRKGSAESQIRKNRNSANISNRSRRVCIAIIKLYFHAKSSQIIFSVTRGWQLTHTSQGEEKIRTNFPVKASGRTFSLLFGGPAVDIDTIRSVLCMYEWRSTNLQVQKRGNFSMKIISRFGLVTQSNFTKFRNLPLALHVWGFSPSDLVCLTTNRKQISCDCLKLI